MIFQVKNNELIILSLIKITIISITNSVDIYIKIQQTIYVHGAGVMQKVDVGKGAISPLEYCFRN
jgi:hypothetical protein